MKNYLSFLIYFFGVAGFLQAQQGVSLPYKGGGEQFESDLSKSLLIEAGNSGRVYFVEVSYSVGKKEPVFSFHGAVENDVITWCVRGFFRDNSKKWNIAFLKKTNVLIPLFISPADPNKIEGFMETSLNVYADAISKSFAGKVCFLYKPVYVFNQCLHVDMEPIWE